MQKLLFISHESSRSGAPLVLLYFVKWLKQHHKEIDLSVLAIRGGSLSEEFKLVVDNYYEYANFGYSLFNWKQKLRRKFLNKVGLISRNVSPKESLIRHLGEQNFAFIYANTVVSISLAHKIKMVSSHSKLVVHVHELESEIKRTVKSLDKYRNEVDLWIAASKMVKNNLVEKERIPSGKIEVIYSFTRNLANIKVKKDLNFFRVGGSGKFGYRKGSDLFIQTARYINRHYPEHSIKLTWVGTIPENDKALLEIELEKLKEINIEFVGEVENPEDYFKYFDVFLLTSREDPFPLVCIEAGMIGMPIICFENTTGITEIISEKGGFVVPYLDIAVLAEKIIFYQQNPEVLVQHSEFNKLVFQDFTAERKIPEIYKLLERLYNSRR